MIIREFYGTREDGKDLYRTYSDLETKIRQVDTGILYEDAIDVEDVIHEYEETDVPYDSENL